MVVIYRTVPPKIAVGQHFAVEARVCAKGAAPRPPGCGSTRPCPRTVTA